MLKLSYYISQRYRKAKLKNRFISFIALSSTFGIALGVAALIIALSVMNGFERELVNRLLSIVPHVEYISVNQPIEKWQQKLESIQKLNQPLDTHPAPQVIGQLNAVAPYVPLKGMVQKGTLLHGIEIRGVDTIKEQQVSNIQQYIQSGSWQALDKTNNGVILGAGIADKLGVELGDVFQVMLPQSGDGFSLKPPKFADLTLVGTFKMGGQLDFSWGYISLASAQKLSGLGDAITGIRLNIKDVYLAELLSRQVAMQLTDTVYMISWFRSQGHLYDDIQLVRFIMHLVLFIVIAVASFNIVSTLVMAVKEKQGDIAILKTMGASDNTIVFTFMLQGLGNGLKGVFYGAVIGVVVAIYIPELFTWLEMLLQTKFLEDDVYFINFIPSMLQAKDVAVAVGLALVTSIIATIYPARQAIKIDPARVLGQM